MDDPVNKPSHYCVTLANGVEVECMDLIEALGLDDDAYVCQAFQYIFRHKKKDGYRDIKKAWAFLGRRIQRLEA